MNVMALVNLIHLAGECTPGTVQFVGFELRDHCMNIG